MIDKDLNIYDDVCTGCSACTEACSHPDDNGTLPIKLIKKENNLSVPRIDMDICVGCKACYKACPTEDKIYNNHDLTYENYKASIGTSYFGYSVNEDHRFEAATAGIVTEIASYLLDTNQVDGVLSSYQDDQTNEIISKIYTDAYEVRKTMGSIYRQVTLLNGLDQKIKDGNHKKLLIIGLPCHIAGIKTLKKANKYLKDHVEFITLALFCKQTKSEEFSDYIRSVLGAKADQKISFRGQGWPGVTRANDGNRLSFTHTKFNLNWATFAFTPSYCFMCSDPLGINADISVGDAWLKQYRADKIGSSLFIANTKVGEKIVNDMQVKKIIYAKQESQENIVLSQNISHIKFKTSFPLERDMAFGSKRGNVNSKAPNDYSRLIVWIKINKAIYEFLERNRIINFTPNFLIRFYGKINSVGYKIFR